MTAEPSQRTWLWRCLGMGVAMVMAKFLIGILGDYRYYFPPDFDQSSFLLGRRPTFHGLYRAAFYTHLITSPPALLLGTFLFLTGTRPAWRRWHRTAGKCLIGVVLLLVAPSGLVMSTQSLAGPVSDVAFAALSLATGGTAWLAFRAIRAGRVAEHQRWATRCFLLLCSPILLRLMTATLFAVGNESPWGYRISAWASWLILLAGYEIWRRHADPGAATVATT